MGECLAGQVIINTRPKGQQASLTAMLESEGARVLSLPAIEIVEVEENEFLVGLAQRLSDYQVALFISRNAVEAVFRLLGDSPLPQALQLGVIGEGTRTALAAKVDKLETRLIRGEPYNSEGLLQVPALQQLRGRKIIIFRGQPGRSLLGDELIRRGARVSYCEVYRRQAPRTGTQELAQCLQKAVPSLILFTSNEGMHNLLGGADLEARNQLLRIPWLLISERIRESALKLGHNAPIIIASSASDDGIFRTVCDWAKRQ